MFIDVLQNSCSKKFLKFHRKAPVSEAFLIKLQALRITTLLTRDSCEKCEIFKSTLFYWIPPVAVFDSFRFPACNFIEKEIPAKMFFCEFCKIFKNIFWQNTSGWLLLVFICEFWDVFQNTSFIEHLGETAILCTSCRISTTRYSKKLFHRCFSSILYKNEK